MRIIPKYIFLISCLFFMTLAGYALAGHTKSDLSLQDTLADLKAMESMTDARNNIILKINDNRRNQKNMISLSKLEEAVHQTFAQSNIPVNQSLDQAGGLSPPVELIFNVHYFGLYQTSTNIWGARSIINTTIRKANYESYVPFNSDILFHRARRLSEAEKKQFVHEKILKTREQVEKLLLDPITRRMTVYKKITTYGYAPIDKQFSFDETLQQAKIDAFQRGSSMAWGIELHSITQVVDMADVSEVTTTESKGIILGHKVINEHTTITSDDYLCVVLEMVIAK